MKLMRFLVLTLFILLISKPDYGFSKCPKKLPIPQTVPPRIEGFLSHGLYTLHLELTREDFFSNKSLKSKSAIFDTMLNVPYWSTKIKGQDNFSIFWNWVRFQYWGLIQQQGLVREDQGFKIVKNKTLSKDSKKISRLPIYPSIRNIQPYKCHSKDFNTYPCKKVIFLARAYFSPSLACEPDINLQEFTFDFLISKNQYKKNTSSDWSILDIKFKGRNLIADTFVEFQDQRKKYGLKLHQEHVKHLIQSPLITPETHPQNVGVNAFYKKYTIRKPKYSLEF